jgi:hypothetical protein
VLCEGFLQNKWILSNAALCEEVGKMAKLQKKCHIEALKSGVFEQQVHTKSHGYCTKFLIECLKHRDFI